MRKIPTVFERETTGQRLVTSRVVPGCEWVLRGEGVARRKFDGTCVMLDDEGRWWNRREVRGEMPAVWIDPGLDVETGRRMVWVPNSPGGFQAQLVSAVDRSVVDLLPGTYELCGPRIDTRGGSNPEGLDRDVLVRHDDAPVVLPLSATTLTFSEVRRVVVEANHRWGFEGVVWTHPDGRRAKVKARDFTRDLGMRLREER